MPDKLKQLFEGIKNDVYGVLHFVEAVFLFNACKRILKLVFDVKIEQIHLIMNRLEHVYHLVVMRLY